MSKPFDDERLQSAVGSLDTVALPMHAFSVVRIGSADTQRPQSTPHCCGSALYVTPDVSILYTAEPSLPHTLLPRCVPGMRCFTRATVSECDHLALHDGRRLHPNKAWTGSSCIGLRK